MTIPGSEFRAPLRAVVATQDADGRLLYQYGWVGEDGVSYEWEQDRVFGTTTASTTVSWLDKPSTSYQWPTDADFERPEIAPAKRALPGAMRQLAP